MHIPFVSGRLGLFFAFAFGIPALASHARTAADPLTVDLDAAVSHGDLDYSTPTTRSEEGMPIGNGRMGSLVWTTPSALKFQINRCDVFGMDASSVSFPQADTDYASGCGYVDINLVSAGADVFAGPSFNQHLGLYDGVVSAKGGGVTARVLAWNLRDVIAVEIDDQRKHPEPIDIDLRMLRYSVQYFNGMNWQLTTNHASVVRTANHYATSQLQIRDGAILLTQRFTENTFFDSSAIAISVVGRDARPRFLNETTVQLSAAPGPGKFTILIASAATFDRSKNVGDLSLEELGAAKAKGNFKQLAYENATWWHDFWAKGYVAMGSDDGQADFVGGNYLYFLYLMASSSRGPYPPRFGGMLWYTNGDMRRWGSEYWHANTDAYYRDLMPSGHLDLMDPFFSLYYGMRDAAALAAKQQWASEGIYIPEVTYFDGPEPIPDNLVKEFQDLFLARKPYEQASKEFLAYVQTKNCLNSRYNFLTFGSYVNGVYVAPTKGAGIFGHCTHFLSGMSGIASQFWQHYEFTGDQKWLREEGYPIIRGVAEFYAHFPNLKKEADGKYHIYHVNRIESDWDSTDTPSELGAMSTIFPLAIRASEILGVDKELRPKWGDIADNLAPPAPGSGNRGNFDATKTVYSNQVEAEVAAASGLPRYEGRSLGAGGAAPSAMRRPEAAPSDRTGRHTGGNGRVFGNFVARGDGAIDPLGEDRDLKRRFLGFDMTGGFIDSAGDGGARIFRNRLRLREGPGAIDAEHLGGLAFGIHESLMTSETDDSLATSTIHLFPSWPKDWAVTFRLLARGGVRVTAAQKDGKVMAVKLEPTLPGTIKLSNPWGEAPAKVSRANGSTVVLSGAILAVAAHPGEVIRLQPVVESKAP